VRAYEIVRTEKDCLMGKVVAAVELEPVDASRGLYRMPSSLARMRYVAIKILSRVCMERGVTRGGHPVLETPLSEVAIMRALSAPGHDNVLRMLDLLADEACLYIVSEHVGCELFDEVAAHGGAVPEPAAAAHIAQLVHGLRYMHRRGFAHRDVSLENCLLTASAAAAAGGPRAAAECAVGPRGASPAAGSAAAAVASPAASRPPPPPPPRLKLIDFGLATALPPQRAWLLRGDWSGGKCAYQPPELRARLPYDGARADAWMVGVCAWSLVTGRGLYRAADASCSVFAFLQEHGPRGLARAWGLAPVSPQAMDLISACLRVDPWARPDLQALAAHPWLRLHWQPPEAAEPEEAAAPGEDDRMDGGRGQPRGGGRI